MAWRDQMRKASFRGVEFGVTGDDKEAGRRTVVHEFPQREDAYVEDLGAATNRFVLNAFLVGPDYMSARDQLERALNEPGPGTLVHPWYGEITVSQFSPYKAKHTAQDGGMVVFTISFARDSEPGAPAASVNQRLRAAEKGGLAGLLSCAALDAALEILDQAAHVREAAMQAVSDAVSLVAEELSVPVGELTRFASVVADDLAGMASVGTWLWGVYQEAGAVFSGSAADRARAWSNAASRDVPVSVAAYPGSSRARIAANAEVVNSFTRRIAAVEAAVALAETAPESRAQATELRYAFVDALDAAVAAEPPDDIFTALIETRASTLAALAEAARSAPDVIIWTPSAVLPSLALCYRHSGGIDLDADLVARNRVIHPGFVQVAALEVLTYA